MARQSTTDINSQIDRQFKKPGARMHPMQITLFVLCLGIGIGVTAAFTPKNPLPAILGMLIGYFLMFSLQVGSQWERAVVLRMGKFHGLRGPGAFWVVPLVDTIPAWIDHRVQTTTYSAEQTLTKDTVPVDVDAVLFWIVWDAEKAALEVADYRQAIFWAAQTALRDVIG